LPPAQDNSAPRANAFSEPTAAGDEAGNADRCGILVRVSPSLRKELKFACLERGVSLQTLLMEAINDVLVKCDHKPIA